MASFITRTIEALSSCLSPTKRPNSTGSNEMANVADTEETKRLDGSEYDDLQGSLTQRSDGTDSLLVEFGQPRTRNLRKQLVDDKTHKPFKLYDMTNAPLFADNSDTDFIWELNKSFRAEFDYLTSADQITVERGSGNVIGGYGPNNDLSPSELLYDGKFYPEVDRTIVGILAMKWILANNYEKFTAHQAPPIKLSQPRFEEMRKIFLEAFKNSRGSYLLIVSMIVNDLGKNSKLRQLIRDHEPRWEIMNHDEVIYHAARHGKLELINEFDKHDKQMLMKGIQFGGRLNLGQLAQAENVPGSLKGIAELMAGDEDAFPMKFCEIVLDVAGASGHVDSRGANAWIAPVDEAYANSRKCVLDVIQRSKSVQAAYDGVLDHRANLLVTKGFSHLLVSDMEQRSILRIITMARAANKKAAEAVQNAVDSMASGEYDRPIRDLFGRVISNPREALLVSLSVEGVDDGIAIIPYYGPGMLAEAARVTKDKSPELQTKAMIAVLRFFSRILLQTRKVEGKGGQVVECDISWVQGIIRGQEFLDNPLVLDDVEYPEKDPYSEDIQSLMLNVYGLRRLNRRRTGSREQVA